MLHVGIGSLLRIAHSSNPGLAMRVARRPWIIRRVWRRLSTRRRVIVSHSRIRWWRTHWLLAIHIPADVRGRTPWRLRSRSWSDMRLISMGICGCHRSWRGGLLWGTLDRVMSSGLRLGVVIPIRIRAAVCLGTTTACPAGLCVDE